MSTLAVLAKSPVPGRVKTRLCPPFELCEAAALAEAALVDTLAAVLHSPCDRRILFLEGEPGPWLPDGIDIVAQCDGGLGERLADAFAVAADRTVLVGMDTPQVTPEHLIAALRVLGDPTRDAVLGPAPDGGFWAIGFEGEQHGAFDGVRMSTASTCAEQRRRLDTLGLRTGLLAPLRDVDDYADARDVAAGAPSTRFAAEFRRLAREPVPA